MARNNPKPGEKIDWDATGNIVAPSAGRKTSGWLFEVKPPAEIFNWKWELDTITANYLYAQIEDWVVIDSDADEGDYATLTAYLADAPAAGDRILMKEDQTVTVQTVIPSDVSLKFLDGTELLCATNIATSVLKFGNNVIIEGILNIILSQTGTTAIAVELDGDNVSGKINVENSSTGILTTAYHINANNTGNRVNGFAQNTGGGTLTNIIVDNSTEDSNLLTIINEVTNQPVRSRGAYKFRNGLEFDLGSDADGDIYYRDSGVLQRLAKGADDTWLKLTSGIPSWSNIGKFLGGLSFDLGSDADGDIYYRNSGVLQRLPKGTDDDVLILESGLPAWSTQLKTMVVEIGDWDMDADSEVDVAHGLTAGNIRNVSVLIRADDNIIRYPIPFCSGASLTDQLTFYFDGTNVTLIRINTGFFDSALFNATSYNRGWITIGYV